MIIKLFYVPDIRKSVEKQFDHKIVDKEKAREVNVFILNTTI